MTYTAARLVDIDGVTELLRFEPTLTAPILLTGLDRGYPEVRDSTVPNPGQDGENDTTAHIGAAAITLDLVIQPPTPDVLENKIRGLCHPGRRMYFHYTRDAWVTEKRTLVRGAQAPITYQNGSEDVQMTLGLRSIWGYYESTVIDTATLLPGSSGGEGGISFTLSFPITFAAGNVPGATIVNLGGYANAFPYFDIYGGATNPVLKNLTYNEQLAFSSLTIPAGSFVRVDMKNRRAWLNNDPGSDVYGTLDFTTLTWWMLRPGNNLVAFLSTSPTTSAEAIAYWPDQTIL